MAFLGKIGKSLGIGDLTHQPFKAGARIALTAAGAALGGPVGAGIGNAAGTALVGDQNGSRSLRADAINGLTAYGVTSAGAGIYNTATAGGTQFGAGQIGSNLSTAVQGIPQSVGNWASNLGSTAPSAAGQVLTDAAGNPVASAVPGAAGASTAPAAASTAGGVTGFLKNNANWLVPAAGQVLGAASNSANQKSIAQSEAALKAQAAGLDAQGQQLLSSASTGTLPPGAQNLLDRQLETETAGIRSQYASMGLSGSSMEGQAIAAAQNNAITKRFDLATSLSSTGLQMLNASSPIYQKLFEQGLQQDQGLQEALGNFGMAFGMGQRLQANG